MPTTKRPAESDPAVPVEPVWSVYLVRTCTGSLYTGITTNVPRRFAEHEAGTGAKNLRGKGPLRLAYCCTIGTQSEALKVEARVKKLPKKRKELLVAGGLVLDIPGRSAPIPGLKTGNKS